MSSTHGRHEKTFIVTRLTIFIIIIIYYASRVGVIHRVPQANTTDLILFDIKKLRNLWLFGSGANVFCPTRVQRDGRGITDCFSHPCSTRLHNNINVHCFTLSARHSEPFPPRPIPWRKSTAVALYNYVHKKRIAYSTSHKCHENMDNISNTRAAH